MGYGRVPGAPRRLVLVAMAIAATGCDRRPAPVERLLEVRREVLRAEIDRHEPLTAGDVLVVLREPALQELVGATLPLEVEVEGKYLVRAESARIRLHTGLAILEIAVRASPIGQPDVAADLAIVGAVDFSRAEPSEAGSVAGAAIVGRVELFGLDTRDVRLGTLSPPVEALIDGLARTNLAELNSALELIPVPLRLVEVIDLPAVETDEVTIPEAQLDALFQLRSIRVLEEGVFVDFDVDRTTEAWVSAFPLVLSP